MQLTCVSASSRRLESWAALLGPSSRLESSSWRRRLESGPAMLESVLGAPRAWVGASRRESEGLLESERLPAPAPARAWVGPNSSESVMELEAPVTAWVGPNSMESDMELEAAARAWVGPSSRESARVESGGGAKA